MHEKNTELYAPLLSFYVDIYIYIYSALSDLYLHGTVSPKTDQLLLQGSAKSLALPGRKQTNVSVRMAWISFAALPCRKRNLITARVSIFLRSRASLTCFRACFLPGRAKDLSAPRYAHCLCTSYVSVAMFMCTLLASVPIDGRRTVGRNFGRSLKFD